MLNYKSSRVEITPYVLPDCSIIKKSIAKKEYISTWVLRDKTILLNDQLFFKIKRTNLKVPRINRKLNHKLSESSTCSYISLRRMFIAMSIYNKNQKYLNPSHVCQGPRKKTQT